MLMCELMLDFHKIIISTLFLLLDRESVFKRIILNARRCFAQPYRESCFWFLRVLSMRIYGGLKTLVSPSEILINARRKNAQVCTPDSVSGRRVLLERRSNSRPNSKRQLKRDTSTCKQFSSNEGCASLKRILENRV